MDNRAESASLYFKSGSSDKVYHASIESADGGFVVTFAYGRRGATLTTGTKTKAPVDHATAQRIFEKLVSDKRSKGYTDGDSGTPYLHSDKAGRVSGLLPQLLNVIDEGEAARVVADPHWVMQEKFDGRRLMLRKIGTVVEGVNKLGLVVSLSAPVAAAALALSGDFVLDGEVIGDRFHVFDLLSRDSTDLRERPYRDRYSALTALIDRARFSAHIVYARCWTDATAKADHLNELRERNAEGVVFKRWDAPYRQGRPNSGGTQLKLKFVATISAMVTAVNQQRSVGVSLLDGDDWKAVGNVTVPANQNRPQIGDVVEVRYLYAAQSGGALYQPVLLGVRDDVEPAECVVAQLKLKAS
ncbi:DNA ligase (plasmid) [Mycobacterium sp. MS1601]|uniref:ATP-dependent DNA ligase n=1 Tax=Mycobacterium sp. MS1601 TaxID=1936029 RepID=UPI0009791B36|nr:WGR domain-containing protein [Mycobacterium sp. MS1601]AQA06881.1 DNA ligase [Mycobacterium sp. MS1601]